MGTISGIKTLILVGMPASGKSNIADCLKANFDMLMLDSDSLIEEAYSGSINRIFAERKEAYFRALEGYVVAELSSRIIKAADQSNFIDIDVDAEHKSRLTSLIENGLGNGQSKELVLSTGGGMPIHADHMTRLKALGMVAYLVCPAEVLEKRLNDDQTRPLLKNLQDSQIEPIKEKVNKERLKRITALLSERESVYRQAHISIETTFHTEEEIANRLWSQFKSWKM